MSTTVTTIPRLLTAEQVAVALALRPATIRDWILKRKIEVVRPGGRLVRIPASEVERLVVEGTTPRLM